MWCSNPEPVDGLIAVMNAPLISSLKPIDYEKLSPLLEEWGPVGRPELGTFVKRVTQKFVPRFGAGCWVSGMNWPLGRLSKPKQRHSEIRAEIRHQSPPTLWKDLADHVLLASGYLATGQASPVRPWCQHRVFLRATTSSEWYQAKGLRAKYLAPSISNCRECSMSSGNLLAGAIGCWISPMALQQNAVDKARRGRFMPVPLQRLFENGRSNWMLSRRLRKGHIAIEIYNDHRTRFDVNKRNKAHWILPYLKLWDLGSLDKKKERKKGVTARQTRGCIIIT